MICSQCKENEAHVFIRTNINGQESETNLCDSCAKKFSAAQGGPFSVLSDILNNPTTFTWGLKPVADLLALLSKGSGFPRTKIKSATCPSCGFNLRSFQSIGKLGCPDCYRQFHPEFLSLLKKIQGQIRHKGKQGKTRSGLMRPAKKDTGVEPVPDLKTHLEEAVRHENYELAAKLRDQMRGLKKGRGPKT